MVRGSIRVCASLLLFCSYLPLFAQRAGDSPKTLSPGAETLDPAKALPPANPTVTGKGTVGNIPMWDTTSDIINSVMFQKTSLIGIGTTTPAATLDVKGTGDVRDTLTLFPSGTHSALALNGTAFKISNTGVVTFVAGQTFPGTGTVTSVTGGAGLAGGTITHTGTLSIATGGVTNTMLQHPSLTLTAGAGLSGGGAVALGSSVKLNNAGVLSVGNGTGLTNTGGQTPTLAIDTSVVPTLTGVNLFTGFSDFDGTEPSWEVEVSNSGPGDAIIASNTSVDSTHPTLSLTNHDSTSAGDLVFDALGPSFGGECTIDVTGNLFCTGTLAAVVKAGAKRSLGVYSVQSPENWIEDFGSGALFGGVATINLEPGFAKTISGKADYHVFLTPGGECEGLYIAGRTPTSFEVRELRRGTSNVAFEYRIVGHRKGLESARLPVLNMGTAKPVTPQGPAGLMPRSR
jgi:hypothetical protein